ncbi:AraC family transcriptional regulator [Tenacibaculum sp. M341]|uniref:AraC family transcriptional regulator n=1 Tax=Tenacibaculum sp. M341 TaxID=2530339 RepID=UPI00104B6D50|nr:AraC family transcriptional regulator [Tenacibaculum sp. M341]TCI90346.1 helix-turn-helix domain-containing protein [Tenacibaculum sp. M341]
MYQKLENNQEVLVNEFGFMLMLSGNITVTTNSETYLVKPKTFSFVSNNFNIIAASPFIDAYFIPLDTPFFKNLPEIQTECKNINEFSFAFLNIMDFQHKKSIIDNIKAIPTSKISLLKSYLHILANQLINDIKNITVSKLSVFEQFENLIETNIENNFCAGTYAEMLNIPLKKLIKEVKVTTNKTPCNIITEKVIEKAKTKLLESNDTSQMIAYQLGFEDPYYFIKYFKKNTSFTPTQFRTKFKKVS